MYFFIVALDKRTKDYRRRVNAFLKELTTLMPDCLSENVTKDNTLILKNTVDFIKANNGAN